MKAISLSRIGLMAAKRFLPPIAHSPNYIVCRTFAEHTERLNQMPQMEIIDAVRSQMKLQRNPRTPLPGNPQTAQLRSTLYRCDNPKEIYNLVRQWEEDDNTIIDESVYGLAMQRCHRLMFPKSVVKIFRRLRNNPNITMTSTSYNILFLTLARFEFSDGTIMHHFKTMYEAQLPFDSFTLNNLMLSCRNRGNIKLALQYWNQLTRNGGVQPTIHNYGVILSVCAKAARPDIAEKFFRQILKSDHLELNTTVIGALMDSYAKKGDVDRLEKCYQMLIKGNYQIDGSTIAILMSGYLKNKNAEKAIELWHETFGDNRTMKHETVTLILLGAAHMQCLERDPTNKTHFEAIVHTIPSICEANNITNRKHEFAKLEFHAYLLYYNENEWNEKVAPFFTAMVESKKLGYSKRERFSKEWCIDCHSYSETQIRFLLRWIFSFEREWLLKLGNVGLLCGRGVHKLGAPTLNQNGTEEFISPLMKTVTHELRMWEPPLHTRSDPSNSAMVHISADQVKHFFHCNPNSPFYN